jgi:hypothetical protein
MNISRKQQYFSVYESNFDKRQKLSSDAHSSDLKSNGKRLLHRDSSDETEEFKRLKLNSNRQELNHNLLISNGKTPIHIKEVKKSNEEKVHATWLSLKELTWNPLPPRIKTTKCAKLDKE